MRRFWGLALVIALALVFATGCAKKSASTAKSTGPDGLQSIYFDFDQSNIKAEYEDTMQDNAKWLKNNSKAKITVEGNCDARGSVEYNIALGDRRAKAAARYLKNLGVSSSRINTVSYGKERPICSENNEGCWWKNRRDDFVVR